MSGYTGGNGQYNQRPEGMATGWQPSGGVGGYPPQPPNPPPVSHRWSQQPPPHDYQNQSSWQGPTPSAPPPQQGPSAYNPGTYGPMPGAQSQPAPALPPRPPREYQSGQQPSANQQAYGNPPNRYSISHPPPTQPTAQINQSGIQGYQQEVGHNTQGWPQHAPYSSHPPTHSYDPPNIQSQNQQYPPQGHSQQGPPPQQQAYNSAAPPPPSQTPGGSYFPPAPQSNAPPPPPRPTSMYGASSQALNTSMTPTENRPTYVPPSLSGQGVAAFVPSNTNPAPGVYVPAPPSHVPAWSMAQNPPNAGPPPKRFTYTPSSNQQQNQAQQWQNSHTAQPDHPPPVPGNRPGYDQQQQPQQYSHPPIPAAYGQASHPAPASSPAQNWQQHPQQGSQQYPNNPDQVGQQFSHGPAPTAPSNQHSPSFTTYQVSPYASTAATPTPVSTQSLLHRDSLSSIASPANQQPPNPRRTSSAMSIGRKPVGGSASNTPPFNSKAPSPKPNASSLGSGGPSDWEHYSGAFELPSHPSPPPEIISQPDSASQHSVTISAPIDEEDERSITPAPLNPKRNTPSPGSQPFVTPGAKGIPAGAFELGTEPQHISRGPSPLPQEEIDDGISRPTTNDSTLASDGPTTGNGQFVDLSVDTSKGHEKRHSSEMVTGSSIYSETNALGSPYELPHQPLDDVEVVPGSSVPQLEPEPASSTSFHDTKLSEAVPDLDYWYLSSLERFVEMLRQEARSNSREDRREIFTAFIEAETRMRGFESCLKEKAPNDPEKDVSTTPVPDMGKFADPTQSPRKPSIDTSDLPNNDSVEEYSPGGRPIIRATVPRTGVTNKSPERTTEKFPDAPQQLPSRENSLDQSSRSSSTGPNATNMSVKQGIASIRASDLPEVARPSSTSNADPRFGTPPSRIITARPSYQAFQPGRKESTTSIQELKSRRGTASTFGRPEHDEMFIGSNRPDESRKSSLASPRSDSISIVAALSPPATISEYNSPATQLTDLLPPVIKSPSDRTIPLHASLQPLDLAFRGFNRSPKSMISNLHRTWERRGSITTTPDPNELRGDYETFETAVFTPAYNGLQAEIAGLMDLVVQLEQLATTAYVGLAGLFSLSAAFESNISPISPPSSRANPATATTPPLNQLLHLYSDLVKAVSDRHSLVINLISARDRLFARAEIIRSILALPSSFSLHLDDVAAPPALSSTTDGAFVITPIQSPPTDQSDLDHFRGLLTHFIDASNTAVAGATEQAVARAKRSRDVIDAAVARGLRVDEADVSRVGALVSSLGSDSSSSSQDIEAILALVERAEEALAALQEQSIDFLSVSKSAELQLNDADAATARAGATRNRAPRELFVRLEAERRAEAERLGQETVNREDGVKERVGKVKGEIQIAKGRLEDVVKKVRLQKALMAAKYRNGEI